MAVEVILPRVDMDMERGKLVAWFAREGESVVKGQPLFEIETDKAAMEVDAPASGVLRDVQAEAGATLPVGATLAVIVADDEVMAPRPRATPKARRLAREAGLDLATLKGTGPEARIQARDVPAAQAQPVAGLHREWLARGSRAPLVLLHGFGADLNGWRLWRDRWPPDRGALALDLPGHGRSPLGEIVSIQNFADAVAAALAAEGLTRAHLVGHSLGGATAATLAAARPDLVASLTLIAPAGFGPGINGEFVRGFLAAREVASLEPWLRELARDPAALGGSLAAATLRSRADNQLAEPQARIAVALLPDGAQAFSVRAALEGYPGPVKVVFGLADRILSPSHFRALPGAAAVHALPGVGHLPHWEARDLVSRLVADNAAAGDARVGLQNPENSPYR